MGIGKHAWFWLGISMLLSLSVCKAEPATLTDSALAEAPKASSPPLEVKARDVTLGTSHTNYPGRVGQAVDAAIYLGLYKAMEKMKGLAQGGKADPKLAPGTMMTFWYTGNVHGEREDCGCPKRPLGGLGRKATMIANEID